MHTPNPHYQNSIYKARVGLGSLFQMARRSQIGSLVPSDRKNETPRVVLCIQLHLHSAPCPLNRLTSQYTKLHTQEEQYEEECGHVRNISHIKRQWGGSHIEQWIYFDVSIYLSVHHVVLQERHKSLFPSRNCSLGTFCLRSLT